MPSQRLALAHQVFDRMGGFSIVPPELLVTSLASWHRFYYAGGTEHDVYILDKRSRRIRNRVEITLPHPKPAGWYFFRSISFLRSAA